MLEYCPVLIHRSKYGRVRRQAQPIPGFVSTPKPGELAQMLRQQKKKK
jgi:hypothetical protein